MNIFWLLLNGGPFIGWWCVVVGRDGCILGGGG